MEKKKLLIGLPLLALFLIYKFVLGLDYNRYTFDFRPSRECINYSETIIETYSDYQMFIDTCSIDSSKFDANYFEDSNLAVFYYHSHKGRTPRNFTKGYLGLGLTDVISYYTSRNKSVYTDYDYYYFIELGKDYGLNEVEFVNIFLA
ncbi:hypothetical protein RJG79_09030 [Mycoplasmatota bacterium WC44]